MSNDFLRQKLLIPFNVIERDLTPFATRIWEMTIKHGHIMPSKARSTTCTKNSNNVEWFSRLTKCYFYTQKKIYFFYSERQWQAQNRKASPPLTVGYIIGKKEVLMIENQNCYNIWIWGHSLCWGHE